MPVWSFRDQSIIAHISLLCDASEGEYAESLLRGSRRTVLPKSHQLNVEVHPVCQKRWAFERQCFSKSSPLLLDLTFIVMSYQVFLASRRSSLLGTSTMMLAAVSDRSPKIQGFLWRREGENLHKEILALCHADIYRQITDMKEYYLTAAEESILAKNAPGIVARHFRQLNGTVNICELGAGDGRKTKILLNALINANVPFEYIPIDVSEGAMETLFRTFQGTFGKSVHMHGVVATYEQGLEHIVSLHPERQTVVLFLGSSIGNFPPHMAQHFFKGISARLRGGDLLLLGSDLKKNPRVLQKAYDDSGSITKKFNLNLLKRLNRELGADFEIDKFHHHALYDPQEGCMKSFLLSMEAQTVYIPRQVPNGKDLRVSFEPWEPILTEHSFKYSVEEVHTMLKNAGFEWDADYKDADDLFLDTVATVRHTKSNSMAKICNGSS